MVKRGLTATTSSDTGAERIGESGEGLDYGYFATEAEAASDSPLATPPASDLDRNGVPNAQQPGFRTLTVEGTQLRIGVAVAESQAVPMIEAVASERLGVANPMLSAGSPAMPLGLVHTRISLVNPGDEATLVLYLPASLSKEARWYEADGTTGTMREVQNYARISLDRKSVTLTVRDGGFGDADGVANGVIVTASGPGIGQNVPTGSTGGRLPD